jgi:hypothetical protein
VRNPDPNGYYAALNLKPEATQQEIRLAYELLKQAYKGRGKKLDAKIRAAYEVLGDPQRRKEYVKERPRGTSPLNSVPLLVVLLVCLLGVAAFLFAPSIMATFITFETGDNLHWKETMNPLGVVLEYDAAHRFDGGTPGPAYLIEPTAGPPMWYPAGDLNRHCARR